MVLIFSSGSFNLTKIVESQSFTWFVLPFFPTFLIFFISALAETSRVPFDFPEAESELVSGYNVEYSSVTFVLFFLSEYCRIVLVSTLIALLFLGGWESIFNLDFLSSFLFSFKTLGMVITFIWIRGVLPRFRYDSLMGLLWKVFLPLSFGYFVFIFSFFCLFDFFPFLKC